ncbi:type II toxin-antitoxin system HicB family antitoxin [Mucilaginibacter psychrotolerans]|uniref:Type II toxin-antitoxin system HicB family antitoxin n=1 Tax=Mucilaginibacter psychrotolerans TaxID=1524096 RepID=A0A4Y8S9K2_9SPHI|nr:type II toxin-antitoxin system HicB family antitoxin [Mucilaginibacter psychrotolerans]TFF35207.1 type II toxin-antitoxin system HicB family antitoxin [Mucilaginibacter psychrotolerans]
MKQRTYRILLTPEDEGGFSVSVPALPGCFTQGETVDEAIAMAKEAIGLYIESLEADGEPVPDDSNNLEYSLTLAS